MSRITIITTTSIVALLAGAANAEGFSGTVGVDYTYSLGLSPDSSVSASNQSITGFTLSGDYELAGGMYVGAIATYDTGLHIFGATDYYVGGTTVSVHLGKPFSWGTGEVFAGYADADGHDPGMSQRYFGGVAAGYTISPKLSVNGQLGYMDGDKNASSSNGDAIRQAVFANIGVKYALQDNLTLAAGINGASGLMDQDDETSTIIGVKLGVDYVLDSMPNLTLYSDISYNSYFQGNENDWLTTTQITVGISYAFGKTQGPRALLGDQLPISEWMGLTDGVME